jgi:hypothetical protein
MLAYADQKIKIWDMEDKKQKGGLAIMSRKEKFYIVLLYCIVYLSYLTQKN